MANINLTQNKKPMDAAGARALLETTSWMREDVEFIDADDNSFIIPAGQKIVSELNKQAIAKALPNKANDYLAKFEKEHNLRNPDIKTKARNVGQNIEYDSFVLSLDGTAGADPANRAKFRKILIDEMRSTEALGDRVGEGANAKRAIFISETHDNTGAAHYHILAQRFGLDTKKNFFTTGVDYSSTSVISAMRDRIKDALKREGLSHFSFSADSTVHTNLEKNEQQTRAIEATQAQILEAGGALNSLTVVTPDIEKLRRHGTEEKVRLERMNLEVEKLQSEISKQADLTAKIDQAVQLFIDNEVLTKDKQDLTANLETVTSELETTKVNFENEKVQLEQTIDTQDKEIKLVGAELVRFAPELADQLEAGDVIVINETLKQATDKLETWKEAIGQLPEDVAEKLQADPFELSNIVEDLETQRLTVAELQGELKTSNDNNVTLTAERDNLETVKTNLTEQNTVLSNTVNEVTEVKERLTGELATTTAEKEKLETTVTDLNGKVKELTNEKSTLQSRVTQIESDNLRLTAEKGKLEVTVTELNGTVSVLNIEKSTLQGRISQIELDNERLTKENTLKDEKLETANKELQAVNKASGKLEGDLEHANKDIEKANSTITDLKTENGVLTKSTTVLTTALEKAIADHEAKMAAIVEKLNAANKLHEAQLIAKSAELSKSENSLKQQIKDLEQKLIDTSNKEVPEIKRLQAENETLTKQIAEKPKGEVVVKEVVKGLDADQRKLYQFLKANPQAMDEVKALMQATLDAQSGLTGYQGSGLVSVDTTQRNSTPTPAPKQYDAYGNEIDPDSDTNIR